MMELLGRMPKNMALSGKNSSKFFNRQGHLKRISGLNYWPLQKVLMEKYKIKEEEAVALAEFLVPMLEWYPHKRATAQKMLEHPWLNMPDNYDYKYTDKEYEILLLKKDLKNKVSKDPNEERVEMNELIESDEDFNAADKELTYEQIEGSLLDIDPYDADEQSFYDSDEERDVMKKAKAKQAKINNSFTGPYPLDPTDFNHTDKGPNQ